MKWLMFAVALFGLLMLLSATFRGWKYMTPVAPERKRGYVPKRELEFPAMAPVQVLDNDRGR
jgi:hypothetical protein